ncbi:MAG: hypothetical protein U1C33_02550 [Candidatus Cloacimonadaceae bacterium]|nr:hypothetical protein [Candidatus Cloacimonadaceae bacterium]
MKSIFTYEDEHIGKCYIVIPKIREIHTALGNLVIVFDNGDKRSLDVPDANQEMEQILQVIEDFYSR